MQRHKHPAERPRQKRSFFPTLVFMSTSCQGGCHCSTPSPSAPPPDVPLPADGPLRHSRFRIPGMDCPAEEQMIRMRLEGETGVSTLAFDLPQRQLDVVHRGEAEALLARLLPLGFGATLEHSRLQDADAAPPPATAAGDESRVLWLLLLINAAMFVIEGVAGWLAASTGLMADALDMFADATVYGVALWAVGRTARHKLAAAHLAGWLEGALALSMMAEVIRRALGGGLPEAPTMLGISVLALAANAACLLLLHRHRHGGVHLRASYIFSANDVLANLGVMAAAALVAVTGQAWPDLLIGSAIGLLVLHGAWRILKLRA